MSWTTVYNWPVFRCPRLAGFGCPPRTDEGRTLLREFNDSELPRFGGWVVDVPLTQFRKVNRTHGKEIMEVIDFHTSEGDALLREFIKTLDLNKEPDQHLLDEINLTMS